MRFRNDGEKAAALLSIAHEEEKTEETTEENS